MNGTYPAASHFSMIRYRPTGPHRNGTYKRAHHSSSTTAAAILSPVMTGTSIHNLKVVTVRRKSTAQDRRSRCIFRLR
jgi:hypothetical protein